MKFSVFCLAALLLLTPITVRAEEMPTLSGQSGILIDANTGEVLFAKDENTRRFPASLTKLMTAILLVENKKPDEILSASELAASQEPSNISLHAEEKLTAKDALYALLLHSANDVAVMVAENVAGSVPKFAEKMNEKANDLGMNHTHFVTPSGLHDPNHYSTAHDMALLTRAALQYPEIKEAMHTQTYTMNRKNQPKTLKNQNQLLQENPETYWGGKSGFTDEAGSCLTEVTYKNGVPLISVTLKANTLKGMYNDIERLTSYGYAQYQTFSMQKGTPLIEYPVPSGFHSQMMYTADSYQTMILQSKVKEVRRQVDLKPWNGPLAAGAEVGTLILVVDGTVQHKIPIVIQKPIQSVKTSPTTGTVMIFLLSIITMYRLRTTLRHKKQPQQEMGKSMPG